MIRFLDEYYKGQHLMFPQFVCAHCGLPIGKDKPGLVVFDMDTLEAIRYVHKFDCDKATRGADVDRYAGWVDLSWFIAQLLS